MQRPRRQYPSLRRSLVRVHEDLLTIHNAIEPWLATYPQGLTLFERCVLVLEDRKFFAHMGINWRRIMVETLKAMVCLRHGGASTIDMQLVRTATNYRKRTLKRKIYEMMLSYIIQHRYSKILILRSYLNIAYFGTGFSGASSPSYELFGKHPDQLNLQEASKLASFLVFPKPRSENSEWKRKVSRRSNYIESVYPRYEKRFNKIENRIFIK